MKRKLYLNIYSSYPKGFIYSRNSSDRARQPPNLIAAWLTNLNKVGLAEAQDCLLTFRIPAANFADVTADLF